MLTRIFDKLSSAIVLLGPDGRVIEANAPLCRMVQMPLEAVTGKTFIDLFPEFSGGRAETAIRNALENGMSAFVSARLREKWRENGADNVIDDPAWTEAQRLRRNVLQFHISSMRDDDGNRICLLEIDNAAASLGRENQLKKTARQHADRAREIETVIHMSGDAVMLFAGDGHILQLNERARELLGLGDAATTRFNIHDMTHAISADPDKETPFGLPDGELREMELYRQDGSLFMAEVVLTELRQSDRHLYILNFRDITARNARQRELEKAREDAEKALAAKTRFLAIMSHEIRTPLSGVMGSIDILMSLLQEQQEVLRHVEFMGTAADALNTIIGDVLEFSKLERHQVKLASAPLSLVKLLTDSVGINQDLAKKSGLALSWSIDEDVADLVIGDQVRLRQILLNLLGNALKFTREGSVTVHVGHCPADDAGEHMLRFMVTDTGIGIDQDMIGGLFTEFTQASADISGRFGGTGLGLAICRSLVTLMGGSIAVESVPGKGSRFWFDVPLPPKEDRRKEERAAEEKPVTPAFRPLRILVVEDSNFNQMILRELLRQMGHDITLVENGRQAVDHLENPANTPDLVFMDIVMPEMDGMEASRAIRAREDSEGREPVVIVALSANSYEEDRQAALAAGMNDFSAKPVTREKLQAAIDAMRPMIDARNQLAANQPD